MQRGKSECKLCALVIYTQNLRLLLEGPIAAFELQVFSPPFCPIQPVAYSSASAPPPLGGQTASS